MAPEDFISNPISMQGARYIDNLYKSSTKIRHHQRTNFTKKRGSDLAKEYLCNFLSNFIIRRKRKEKKFQVAKVTECGKLNLFNAIGVHPAIV